jgi:hypothetical protein
MSAIPFDSRLKQALDFSSGDPYSTSYEWLKEIARSIEGQLNSGLPEPESIVVDLEPGFQANIGQQLRVVIRIPKKQFRDTLFRAYIPTDGLPIYLDLYSEEPEQCASREELEQKVLGFLQRIRDRMVSYRDYASK